MKGDTTVEINGKVYNRILPEGIEEDLTPLDCGMWASYVDILLQNAIVIRRAQAKGFALTEIEDAALKRIEGGEPALDTFDLELCERSMTYVNDAAPVGYRIGYKVMDVWFMPTQWWDDMGGEE